MGRRVGREAPRCLCELALAGNGATGHGCVMPRDGDVDEALKEVPLGRIGCAPSLLECLVRSEELTGGDQLEAALVRRLEALGHADDATLGAAVATILVAGVDLFFRGKLDALLGASHKLVTTDSVEDPDLVIVDIARVDPEEVAEEYPDIPILGFTNHTDTAGLRAAQAAGFDRVVVRSALAERAPQIVEELVA